jgi:5'-nucleotidase
MLRILLTNDDAYHAPGINELYRALRRQHDVYLVAPDREQSAASHALTLHKPLRLVAVARHCYRVDGTPADCVMLGLHALKLRPDMIISGINHGANLGEDVIYSGTVAAAREGALAGVPSFAVSVVAQARCRYEAAVRFMTALVRTWSRCRPAPATAFWNINVPNVAPSRVRGVAVTGLDRRTYHDIVQRRRDPRGRDYYWISGTAHWHRRTGSDFEAVAKRKISVTPLTLALADRTAYTDAAAFLNRITV